MSDLVAITFTTADAARQAIGSVRALEHEGMIGLEDTAIVTKGADGKIKVENEASSGTETGAAVGAILGGMLFFIFPVGAIIGGAIVGGLVGRAVAPGIDGKFVKDVEAGLAPGGSALFLLIKRGNPGLLIAAMRKFEGQVIQTSLDEEQEAALRASLQ